MLFPVQKPLREPPLLLFSQHSQWPWVKYIKGELRGPTHPRSHWQLTDEPSGPARSCSTCVKICLTSPGADAFTWFGEHKVQKARFEAFSVPQMKPNHLLWNVQLLSGFCYAGPQQHSPVSISTKAHGDLLCFWQQDWAITWRGAPINSERIFKDVQGWRAGSLLMKWWWYRRFTENDAAGSPVCSFILSPAGCIRLEVEMEFQSGI